jgi:hypothetical protein
MANQRYSRKRRNKPPPCPWCGTTATVPVIDLPLTPSLKKAITQGRALLADREEWEGVTQWHCKTCGCEWRGQWLKFKKNRPALHQR